ncbi:MAG TPA: NADP-dependent oxidoreductase [Chloroflexota bacterium]
MSTQTMRAVRYHDYGPPDVLQVEDVPQPEPGEGEVLVRVRSVGVHPVDWKLRSGMYRQYMPLTFPYTPGVDLAGVVESIGPGVTGFEEGQDVYGRGPATNAELAAVPVVGLAPKPGNLTFEQAAAIPVGVLTAWTGLFDVAGLQPGQRLLVHGAAGGVGNFGVQLGRWKGAEVIGTSSGRNTDFVRSLGASTALDYGRTRFEDVVRDVDVVLDNIGGETQQRSWQVLKPGGILVGVAGLAPEAEERAEQLGLRAGVVSIPPDTRETLQHITDLIEAGTIVPELGPVFSMDEVSGAHALSETGHGRGRIILRVTNH